MSGRYTVLKKVTLHLDSPFGVHEVSKRDVLEAIRQDLNASPTFKSYMQEAKVSVTLENGVTRNLDEDAPSPFESLPTKMQDCIAQYKIPRYNAAIDTLRENDLQKLRALSRDECFEAWCEWNGLLNFVDTLRNAYQEIYAKVGVIR